AGCRAGVFATDDTTGRRNLMAAADRRSSIAFKAVRELMRRGAHTVLVSFQHEAETVDPALVSLLGGVPTGTHWASRERETQGYLPLRKDFEESIAPMGKKTRINLRYYRKMVENELGARFAPEASISREDFLELNRASAFAVSDETAVWRHESLKLLAEPVLAGIKDRDGRWISMAGGRRFNRWLEVHWLMNRNDLPAYSLSTVIRAYLIDNEAALGSERIYFQGGTIHSIRSAFQAEKVTDLVVMRRALRAPMRLFVERMLPEDNMLRQVLLDKELEWRPVHP
ncbi:MAG TPA: hypothetical protein VL495_09105, partial [Edaphobacter sp.]|nr:hypothetical protein [Edaphobacter sp.]